MAGIVIIGGIALLGELPWIGALFLGWAGGALFIKATTARRIMKAWPTIAEIVDWQRVSHLLGE